MSNDFFSKFVIRYSSFSSFLQLPNVFPIRMTMAMCRKKSTAKLPNPWPDLFLIRLGDFYVLQRLAREELKTPLAMDGWQRCQFLFHLKQKHQPVTLPQVTVLAHDTCQVQIRRRQFHAKFFFCLTARTGIRRFANI